MSVDTDDQMSPREVNSLKKLASTNFARFAIQVQHASAEAQMKIIEQLPEFRKLATEAIEKISKAYESTLNSTQQSEEHVHQGIREWRGALLAMLEDPSLSLDDKFRITAQISETVKAHRAVLAEGNKVKAALYATAVVGIVGVVGIVVVAITGGKFGIDQGDNT